MMKFPIYPIGSKYGIYANIWGTLMVNVTIYSIPGSYGYGKIKNVPNHQPINNTINRDKPSTAGFRWPIHRKSPHLSEAIR
jgi:hypothetical protein